MAFWEDEEITKEVKSESLSNDVDLSGKMSTLKEVKKSERVVKDSKRLSKNLLGKLAALEERLASVEKKDQNFQHFPGLDEFIKFCNENRVHKTCAYFAKRFENPKSPDDATVRKVLDVLRLMNS